ncbi:MAG: hypothetical protein KDE46_19045, partial [Caldilineaceae bacterium]|nr:hypothetical protein [Caldilineaceae bacterium]
RCGGFAILAEDSILPPYVRLQIEMHLAREPCLTDQYEYCRLVETPNAIRSLSSHIIPTIKAHPIIRYDLHISQNNIGGIGPVFYVFH